jgi:hypothetical protein
MTKQCGKKMKQILNPFVFFLVLGLLIFVSGCGSDTKDAIKEWRQDKIAENEKNYAEYLEFNRKNTKQMENDAREAGRKAHSAGISEIANPETSSQYRRAWLEGYIERKTGKK